MAVSHADIVDVLIRARAASTRRSGRSTRRRARRCAVEGGGAGRRAARPPSVRRRADAVRAERAVPRASGRPARLRRTRCGWPAAPTRRIGKRRASWPRIPSTARPTRRSRRCGRSAGWRTSRASRSRRRWPRRRSRTPGRVSVRCGVLSLAAIGDAAGVGGATATDRGAANGCCARGRSRSRGRSGGALLKAGLYPRQPRDRPAGRRRRADGDRSGVRGGGACRWRRRSATSRRSRPRAGLKARPTAS